MRAYNKEFQARTRARIDLFNSQTELRDSSICRAAAAVAAELVSHAVESALTSLDRFSSTRSLTTDRISSTRALTVSPHEALKRCVICRAYPCKCRDDVEDECMVCNQVPCVCAANENADQLVTNDGVLASSVLADGHLLDSAERLLTTDALDDAVGWPLEQMVAVMSQAARAKLPDMEWQEMTGKKTLPQLDEETPSGGAVSQCITEAFQSGPETESYVTMPIGMTGELVRAEQHPLAGFSIGGAHSGALSGGSSSQAQETSDDSATTDSELAACIGFCETGDCASGCRCSARLKRRRPMIRAPAADLPGGTFKRPPLFRKGDAVEFAAPERRIQVRTFGTVDDVQHVGAEPRYVVTSVKGTVYSFAEDCLRSRGATDPVFALQGSELVTINDLTTAGTSQAEDPPSHHHMVLMLDTVPEADDDEFPDAEAGQDVAEQEAADAVSELASAQSTVMATFEARLQQRDEDVQAKLQEQFAAITARQEQAYQRMLLTLSTHQAETQRRADSPLQSPVGVSAATVDVNPRLAAPRPQ